MKQMLCTGGMLVSQMTNKHKLGAWGLVGGKEGKTGATLFKKSGSDSWETAVVAYGKVSPSKYSNIPMQPGDRVRVLAPGGGGYGYASERERNDVLKDVEEGYISKADAMESYSVKGSDL